MISNKIEELITYVIFMPITVTFETYEMMIGKIVLPLYTHWVRLQNGAAFDFSPSRNVFARPPISCIISTFCSRLMFQNVKITWEILGSVFVGCSHIDTRL